LNSLATTVQWIASPGRFDESATELQFKEVSISEPRADPDILEPIGGEDPDSDDARDS